MDFYGEKKKENINLIADLFWIDHINKHYFSSFYKFIIKVFNHYTAEIFILAN